MLYIFTYTTASDHLVLNFLNLNYGKKIVENTKKVSLRPLMGYLLVESVAAETKTASGLYLPETAQEKPAGQGVVVAVGADMVLNGQTYTSPVKVGEKIVYKK